MTWKTDLVLPSQLSDEDVSAWGIFNAQSPGLSVAFLSHPYALAAENVFPNVRVCRVERDGKAVLFFPFQFRSSLHRLFGIGQRLAGELSDYFGVVADGDVRLDPKALLKMSRLQALLFTHLAESQAVFGLAGHAPEPGHLIEFPAGGRQFWEERRSLDKKFVQDTERREKKLAKDIGAIKFVFDCPDLPTLESLIATKRDQYRRTGAADTLADPSARAFLRHLAGQRHSQCRGILSTLYAGDVWVASHFGLRCEQTLHYWFPVYNPQLSAYGPGRLLIKQVIEAGANQGVTRIDRGAGDSAAKRDLSTRQHAYLRGLWLRPGVQGLAYRMALSARWRLAARKSA